MSVNRVAPYYKAVTGAVVAFLSALIAGLQNGGLSWTEILTAIIALLVGGGAVFTIPNIKSNYPPEEVPSIEPTTPTTPTTEEPNY